MLNFTITKENFITIVEFSPAHRHNPFSILRMGELVGIMQKLQNDPETRVVILYGGKDNSFSVGGDFTEVSNFTGGTEVDLWIEQVATLYIGLLQFNKPLIAAIDGYAIGLGLQIALTCDYRIASSTAKLIMPELSMGIACDFGGYMLEKVVGRHYMQLMLFASEALGGMEAKTIGLVHDVVAQTDLIEHALKFGHKLAKYPPVTTCVTKENLNRSFIADLKEITTQAKLSHRKAFSAGAAQIKMKQILKS